MTKRQEAEVISGLINASLEQGTLKMIPRLDGWHYVGTVTVKGIPPIVVKA